MAGWEQLEEEPAWGRIQEAINAVNGDHRGIPTNALSRTHANRVRKIHNEISAILTDVRQIWSYETNIVGDEKKIGDILNKMSRFWWRNRKVDRVLKRTLSLACVAGSGYMMLTWDKDLQDIVPEAVDPRDVIPLEPVFSATIQDWRGVCIRKRIPISDAHKLYPEYKDRLIEQAGNSWFGPEVTRASGGVRKLVSNFWNAVASRKRRFDPPGVEIMRIYMKDDAVNETTETVSMGEEGTNWYYEVPPGKPLWPRGKLLICTPDVVLKVMPNPYWHGMFPLVKFTLIDPQWSLLGLSIIQDVLPLQHSLNESVRGLDDARNKILRPDVVVDQRAMHENESRKIDTRLPGGVYRVDTTILGNDGFKFGQPPDLGNYYLQHLAWMVDQMDELSGVKGVQAFQQLKQMPAKDTIEEFMQAMSPVLKDMARSLEVSVAEVAELMKFNLFQFYGAEKRVQILGEEGLSVNDFDTDPGSLVPAGQDPIIDRVTSIASRFRFVVAPNTFLNLSNVTDRMMKFQLWRAGGYPLWSMWKALDIDMIGEQPAETQGEIMAIERRQGLLPGSPPELVQAQLMAAMAQAQAAMAQMGMGMMTPNVGGGGGGAAATPQAPGGDKGGRPPSGQEPPQIEMKDGGTRMAVTES